MAQGGRLDGKVVLISGGTGGLGGGQARMFVAEGARVVVADIDPDKATGLADELGDRARLVKLDVRQADQWAAAVDEATSAFGTITGLVNNAGIVAMHTVADATEEDYRRVVDVNQVGTFLGMQAVLPAMRAAGGGSIVNISSVAGLVGLPGIFSYVASKWAVRGMTRAAALELAADRIRVNSIHPGWIETPMTADQDFEALDATIPIGRHGQPEDIAAMALYLISDESTFVTGTEFRNDGGAGA